MQNDAKTQKESRYIRELALRLSTARPKEWILIADIAHDVSEFIDVVQMLCNEGHFHWVDNFGSRRCFVEIKENTLVRLDPEYLRKIKREAIQ